MPGAWRCFTKQVSRACHFMSAVLPAFQQFSKSRSALQSLTGRSYSGKRSSLSISCSGWVVQNGSLALLPYGRRDRLLPRRAGDGIFLFAARFPSPSKGRLSLYHSCLMVIACRSIPPLSLTPIFFEKLHTLSPRRPAAGAPHQQSPVLPTHSSCEAMKKSPPAQSPMSKADQQADMSGHVAGSSLCREASEILQESIFTGDVSGDRRAPAYAAFHFFHDAFLH